MVVINFIAREAKGLMSILKNRADLVLAVAVLAFIVLNVLKISLFNFYMMPEKTLALFGYKFQFTLFVVAILYPLLFVFRNKLVLPVFYGLQSLYMLINIGYYMYFRNYLHIAEALHVFEEGFTAIRNFSAPLHPAMLLVIIDLPILIYIVRRYSGCPVLIRKSRFVLLSVMIFSLFSIAAIEKDNFAQKVSFKQTVKNYYEGEGDIVERYGTLFNNGVSVYNSRDYSYLANNFVYGETKTAESKSKRHPNFVFIQVESMDSNIIDQTHEGQYVTPYLHQLADDSVYYPYTMSYHLGGSTSDTEFSTFNSLHPLADYPSIKLSNYDYSNSFVKMLAGREYETLAFHGNVGGFFNRNLAFPKMGFEQFYDIVAMGLEEQGWGAPDGEVLDFALKTLKETDGPFYAHVITMTSHGPFTNASNYYENPLFDTVSKKRVRNYYTSMAYVDEQLEKFVADIESNFTNTYIIIMGDHTPAIHSGKYVQASYEENERYFEFVPLFIITPDRRVYRETRMAASFLDIAPTIMTAAKVDYEICSDGLDLLAYPNKNRNVPFLNGSFDRYSLFAKVPRTNNEDFSRLASAGSDSNNN